VSGAGAEVDASVCYRHPDRTSWTLCERCGRTICPECQILTPQGVRCPTCIEELGGSVQWAPAAGPRPQAKKPKRVRARSTTALDDRPGWQRVLIEMLRPGGSTPVLSWGAAAITLVVWIAGFFSDAPAYALAVLPQEPYWQIWRFVTTDVVYPGGLYSIIGALFATLFLASGATGAAWMAIAGLPEYGLFTPIFGLLGCYLVLAWENPRARMQMLVMLGFILVLNLVINWTQILAMIGAFAAGVGGMQLFRRADHGPRSPGSLPYIVLIGGAAFFVVIAIVRQLAAGA
jgi:hypothetical protein